MPINPKFVVLEGLDGSGKATQTELLIKQLKKRGQNIKTIEFPQYGQKSAGMIEEYLSGKYGKSKEVNPQIASIFYACDRYDASFEIRKWIKKGYFVIADRYISSNVAHQGGKIKNPKKRKEFTDWLYFLEYQIFNIPKPDKVIFLKTSPEFSIKSLKEKSNKDIHEKDLSHLKGAYMAYMDLVKHENFAVVEVTKNNDFLPPEEINKKILKIIFDYEKIS